jgi:hypothetical protein
MGRTYDAIDDHLRTWLAAQPLFFVGTAPLAGDGHVNISPKGLADTFAVLGPGQVAYLDLTGSGIETVAHLRENGRICLMMCAFTGPPRIVRLHGRGRAVTPGDPAFDELRRRFPARPGARAVVVVDVERIADSCGYAVPTMAYTGDRDRLGQWTEARGPDALEAYRAEKNAESIDGLPGLA